MKSIRALLPIGLCAGLGAAYLYASPYITVYLLSRAIKGNNAQSIAGYIELPSVRDSIRTQIQDYIEYSSKADGYDAAWTALAKGFGGALSEEVVVRATSPDGIERILRTGQFGLDQGDPGQSVSPSQDVTSAMIKYLAFDRVAVVFPPESSQALRSIELTRRNLVDWKITSAEFDFTSPRSKGGASAQQIGCGKAIAEVERSIAFDEGMPIAKFKKKSFKSPFPDRPDYVQFSLGGEEGFNAYDSSGSRKILDFIDSSKAERFSRHIIESCSDVASVSIGKYATGVNVEWFFTRGGVIKGRCVDLGETLPGWGWYYC